MNNELETGTARFLKAALDFCTAVDSATSLSRKSLLSKVGTALVELYGNALALGRVEPDSSDVDNIPFRKAEWGTLYVVLREKFGPLDSYWTVFDSTQQGEAIQASLAGDISEIYFDMKHELELAGHGVLNADVLWTLRASFRQHRGRHAISALKAIHELRSSETID